MAAHTFESSPTLQEHFGKVPPHEAIYQSCMDNLMKYGCSHKEAVRILEPHRIRLDACYAEIQTVSAEIGGELGVLKAEVDLAKMNEDILGTPSTVEAQMAEI